MASKHRETQAQLRNRHRTPGLPRHNAEPEVRVPTIAQPFSVRSAIEMFKASGRAPWVRRSAA